MPYRTTTLEAMISHQDNIEDDDVDTKAAIDKAQRRCNREPSEKNKRNLEMKAQRLKSFNNQ